MDAEAFMPFDSTERQIYRYHDGSSVRAVDPLAIVQKLNDATGHALNADLKLASISDAMCAKEADDATGRLIHAARQAFDLKPFSESADGTQAGLTDAEAFKLLVHFVSFVGGLQKAAVPFLNSPEPSEPADSENSLTDSSSECGSTESESPESKLQPSA